MHYENLIIGTKIYYTGDMANLPADGEIVKVHGNPFYPILYDISLDNGVEKRIARNISPVHLEKSPGRRFIIMSEYEEERNERIKQLQEMRTR